MTIFKRTITNVLTAGDRDSYYDAFSEPDGSDGLLFGPGRHKTSIDLGTDVGNTKLSPTNFAYSSEGNFTSIRDGLSYLNNVSLVQQGVSPNALAKFGQSAQPISGMTRSEGQSFVKNALGLQVVDQLEDSSLIASVNNYADTIFRDLQVGAYSSQKYFSDGRAISSRVFESISVATNSSLGASSFAGDGLLGQVQTFLGGVASAINGLAGPLTLSDVGRQPETKLKVLFYTDITFWDGLRYPVVPLKRATLPKVTFEGDDVNFYGYHSKILKKTNFGTTTISMYNDAFNIALDLYDRILQQSSASYGERALNQQGVLQDNGFGFSSYKTLEQRNGVIKTITTNHVYILDGQIYRDEYWFVNPKTQALSIDDLSMEDSDVSSLELEFTADALYINKRVATGAGWRERG